MRSQRQVVSLLVEAQLRWLGALQAGGKALKNITRLEAALLFVGYGHIKDIAFTQADDERRDPAVSWHIVQRDDLEAGPVGRSKRSYESLEFGHLADDGHGLSRRRLEG